MSIEAFTALLSALNIGSIIAALGAWRKAGQSTKELTHNHGSSTKDAVVRIEEAQKHQSSMIKSLGHQIGEFRSAEKEAHEMMISSLDDHGDRIRSLEQSTKKCGVSSFDCPSMRTSTKTAR